MTRPDGYIGALAITWDNGDKNVFQIAQKKGTIWVGEHIVGPANERSLQGVLREISEIMGYPPGKIRQYNWIELVKPLQFPR